MAKNKNIAEAIKQSAQQMEQLTEAVKQMANIKLTVTVQKEQAEKELTDLEKKIEELKELKIQIKTDVNKAIEPLKPVFQKTWDGLLKMAHTVKQEMKFGPVGLMLNTSIFFQEYPKVKKAVHWLIATPVHLALEVKDHITPKIWQIKYILKGIREKTIPIVTKVRDTASAAIKKITAKVQIIRTKVQPFVDSFKSMFSAVKGMAKFPIKVAAILKDMVSPKLQKIAGVISGIGKMMGNVGAAALKFGSQLAGGIGSALQSGMNLEKQMMSIEHFIGAGGKGLSGDQAKAESQQYVAMLRSHANASPFEADEVMNAGVNALKATGGDSKQAMELVKLAQNMAAVNPGKSLDEAVKTLIDLKTGKGSGDALKEFGFHAQDGTGGDLSGIKNDKGMSLSEAFAGGTDKFAKTGSGMIKTITGSFKAGVQDMGLKMLEALKPALEMLIPIVEKLTPLFGQIGTAIANGIGKGVAFLQNNKASIDGFAGTFTNLFTLISGQASQFINWLMPLLPPIVSFISGVVQKAVQFITPLLPPIINLFQSVIGWVVENMPVFQQAIGAVFDALGPIIARVVDVFTFLWNIWMEAWPTIQDIIQTVWGILEPVFGAISDIIEIIIAVAQKLWDVFKPIAEGLWVVLKPLVEGIGKVAGWLGEALGWVKDQIVGDQGGASANGHAAGLRSVPYDNYPALLHKNEAVLTAQEANQYRNGRGGGNITINLNHPVAREEADFKKWALLLRNELEGAGFNMA
ncbi:hypothetical protein [Paenibacillus sp. MSJ-34]|uniref:hypothetical protein n=2 Tax=unclassified Paenibacillus TaxID=185978 RepID=UPI001C11C43C|nr:hypothetical protein [Paenibacillus sp. MSJ-34]MBU5444321.1 hypothetical protein [Paenibacillus sp. MSJ-34]